MTIEDYAQMRALRDRDIVRGPVPTRAPASIEQLVVTVAAVQMSVFVLSAHDPDDTSQARWVL